MRFEPLRAPALVALITITGVGHMAAQIAFAPARNYLPSDRPTFVVAADVNGDTKTDLIATLPGGLSVLTNNGSGAFGSNATYTVGFVTSAVAADVSGDGKVDLIAADKVSSLDTIPGRLVVLTNDGTGRFKQAWSPATGNRPESVTAADVNDDGWSDLICANASDNTLSVLTNNGGSGFFLSGTYAVGNDPLWVISADVNNDGRCDLICANYLGNSLSVLTNDGGGVFAFCSSTPVGARPLCVVAADVNSDGKLDLITANSNPSSPGGNSLSVCTNDGTGKFVLSATCPVGRNPCGVIAADFSMDGYEDLACANFQDNSISVLTNDGAGGFSLALIAGVGVNPRSLIVNDANGDHQPDLVSANFSGRTLSVLMNVPILKIRLYSNSAVVSYPSLWTNWSLLKTTNLATGNWSLESGVADDGTNKRYMFPSGSNSLFFRLSCP